MPNDTPPKTLGDLSRNENGTWLVWDVSKIQLARLAAALKPHLEAGKPEAERIEEVKDGAARGRLDSALLL